MMSPSLILPYKLLVDVIDFLSKETDQKAVNKYNIRAIWIAENHWNVGSDSEVWTA